MKKERILQLIFIVLSILFVLVSSLINFLLGESFMFLFFLVVFCGGILVFSELYLRIQWNIDKNGDLIRSPIQEVTRINNNLTKLIEQNFRENKEVLGGIVDFLENLLNYLDEEKEKRENEGEGLTGKIENLEISLTEKFDEKMKALGEGLTEKFDEKMKALGEGFNERVRELGMDVTEKMDKISEYSEKLAVIIRQILEYQKDQTDFLNKEFKKLKNGSRTRKR